MQCTCPKVKWLCLYYKWRCFSGYLHNLIIKVKEDGYDDENAEAKVSQDIILKAIAESSLREHITIKGGIVMRSISQNTRRATLDIDIDFIRYSLSDQSIMQFISKLNCIEEVCISLIGEIEELKQQDYHGKRVHIEIKDRKGFGIYSKIDLGVHKDLSIKQDEYCFDLCLDEQGVSLLINSKEQMFVEKLRSLLKFGSFSRRYKDIFDMYYLSSVMDNQNLLHCLEHYIFSDIGMKEKNMEDVMKRVSTTFHNKLYIHRLKTSRRNWAHVEVEAVLVQLLTYLDKIRILYDVKC